MDPAPVPGPHLLVHTGAGAVPPAEREVHRQGALRAVTNGWAMLKEGRTALEAVVNAMVVLEEDPSFNAGVGAVLCREGHVEAEAALMRGQDLGVGAVALISDLPRPVLLAAAVLDADEVLLVGGGACRFARQAGLGACRPEALIVGRERRRLADPDASPPGDAMGAVAVDAYGHVAAATSSGGRAGRPSGTIGAAAVPGAGFYADDRVGAVVATGWGEDLIRTSLARRAAELGRDHTAQDACWMALKEAEAQMPLVRGGLLMLARDGSSGWAFNTPSMGIAYRAGDMSAAVVTGIPEA